MAEISLEQIEQVLDEKVRPQLALHEGNIRVEKLEQDILYVRMEGHCNNCPSAELTLEQTVKTEMEEAFPDLKDIVLVTGVSDDMIADMRAILKRRHGEA